MAGWEWVALAAGLGRPELRNLMEYSGQDGAQIWSRPAQELAALPGMDFDLVDRIDRIRQTTNLTNLSRQYERHGIRPVAWVDPDYPPQLRHKPDAPGLIFISGRLSVDFWRCVAIIGTRKPTAYGMSVARAMAKELAAAGVTIVSGMAYGIDAAAHRGALDAGGQTVAVMGCGLDIAYPRQHAGLMATIREQGGLVSEYPLGTPPLPHNFLERNRILAWLAGVVVVVEAGARSGTMSTVNHADAGNVKVFAVPGPITSPMSAGPNRLIRDGGATIYTDVLDIIQGLHWMASEFRCWASNPLEQAADDPPTALVPTTMPSPDPDPTDVSDNEGAILRHLKEGSATVADLSMGTGMTVASVAAVLGLLEAKGLITYVPGHKVVRV